MAALVNVSAKIYIHINNHVRLFEIIEIGCVGESSGRTDDREITKRKECERTHMIFHV